MARIRIRWRGVARVAAIVIVGLVVLRLVPGLLRAPEPPPLGADVGLPKAEPAAVEPFRKVRNIPAKPPKRQAKREGVVRPAETDASAATAVIGTHHRHRRRRPRKVPKPDLPPAVAPPAPAETTVPPAPEYVPPPPPAASSPPPPEAPPAPSATTGDGSQEFAPH